MSATNTISIRLEVTGDSATLSKITNVLNGFKGLKSGVEQARSSLQQQWSTGGLTGLSAAIGQTQTQVTTLKTRLTEIGSTLASNASAFGVATASVWGVYNAYDSLVKVEIRAETAMNRVSTMTTTLATLENRLAEARATGNLSAEEMAILEDRITDTKAKLATAQERSADLQGDVNEAWAAFATQVGPQVVAAAASITQLVVNMRGSLTGIVPRIKDFINNMQTSVFGINQAKVASLTLSPALGGIGPAGQVAATGIRAVGGAIKGLLIGTGIGLLVVGIGYLIESLGLLNDATATTANETADAFDTAGQGPVRYSDTVRDHMEKATAIIEKYGKDTTTILGDVSAAYVQAAIDDIKADQLRMDAAAKKAKILYDAKNAEIEAIEARRNYVGRLTAEETKQEEAAMKVRAAAAESFEVSTAQSNSYGTTLQKLGEILPNIAEKEASVAEQHRLVTTGTKEMQSAWISTFASMDAVIDDWLAKNSDLIVQFGDEERAMDALVKPWIDYTFGKELNAAATKRLKDEVKALLPEQEKEADTLDEQAKKVTDLAIKVQELGDKFGVEVPADLAASEEGLDAFGKAMDANKEKLEEFKQKTEFLKDITGLEKAFKIEFETDKEVKDFIKDLPKETRKKIKLIIDTMSDWEGVKNIFEIIAPGIFQSNTVTNESGDTIVRVGIRPELNNPEDIKNIADTMIEAIKDQFGSSSNKEPVASIIKKLEEADTETELRQAFEMWGIYLGQEVFKDPSTAAREWAEKAKASVANAFVTGEIINPNAGEGKTVNIGGKLVNVPNEPEGPGGDVGAQIQNQTKLQEALQKTQEAFANLANEGTKSLGLLAAASSIVATGIQNNLNVGYVAAGHLQEGIANLANEGLSSLGLLAAASSKTMSGMRNNLNVGYVAAGHLQVGLANLANQGARSLTALANSSSKNMNGFVNNLKKGEQAVRSLQSAINSLKDKTVHVGLTGPGVKFLAQGYHGVVDKPTLMMVGEAGPERVDVSPAVGSKATGLQFENARNVRVEPVGKLDTGPRFERETVHEQTGPRVIQLVTFTYLYPNSDAYRKSVQQVSLDNTGMFPSV